jgi:MipA family protein
MQSAHASIHQSWPIVAGIAFLHTFTTQSRTTNMKIFTTLVALTLTATINSAAKAQDTGVHGTVVAGVAYAPEYEGADKQEIVPLVIGRINNGNRYLAFEGPTLRANVLDNKGLEFGPVVNITTKRGRDIQSRAVARLGTIKDAVEVGVFAAISRPVFGKDRIRLAVQGVQDVSGVHKGFLSTASANYVWSVSPEFSLLGDVTATYASAKYARKYFSVNAAGAIASGLSIFNAKRGIKDVGGSLSARYAIDKRWSLFGIGAYKRLVGRSAVSPIVKNEGNPNQFVGGIGIGLSF